MTSLGLAGGVLSMPRLAGAAQGPTVLPLEGERYAGFVLLPPGAPPPFDLIPARRPSPSLCGTGLGRGGPELTGRTVELSTPEEVAGYSRLPLYTLATEDGRVLTGARVVEHNDGEVDSATLCWESADLKIGRRSTNLRLTAIPDFERPFPLWESHPVEPGGPAVRLVKEPVLPEPGVRVASVDGFIFHWITGGIYYQLYVENNGGLAASHRLIASLKTVVG